MLEQALINAFVSKLKGCNDKNFQIAELINSKCKSKRYADIEFKSAAVQHWVIEAKSYASLDKHNGAHKVFGELLKETGKHERQGICHYAILIPETGVGFFRGKMRQISREHFVGFGALMPIDTVFTLGKSGVRWCSWGSFYGLSEAAAPAWNKIAP